MLYPIYIEKICGKATAAGHGPNYLCGSRGSEEMTDVDPVEAFASRLTAALGDRTNDIIQHLIADAQAEQPTVAASWRRISDAIERAKGHQ